MELKLETMRRSEQVVYMLRGLYERQGYEKFRMSKFEAYDFYNEHRDFLSSGPILTFTDLSGKLMALKPDVSMSIVKRTRATMAVPERLYYTESVYRASREVKEYKEIFQIGIEYLGGVTPYTNVEVLTLAMKSLGCISGAYVLEISHMGFLSGLLDCISADKEVKRALMGCLENKNMHALAALMSEHALPQEERTLLERLARIGGDMEEGLLLAAELVQNEAMQEALDELKSLYAACAEMGLGEKLRLDFSIALNSKYYNGLIFRGYIEHVPRAVLSGGRYDPLLRRMGRQALNAIGFAVYFDEVERILEEPLRAGYDAVVLYRRDADVAGLYRAVEQLMENGLRVYAGEAPPENARNAVFYRYEEGRLKEADA